SEGNLQDRPHWLQTSLGEGFRSIIPSRTGAEPIYVTPNFCNSDFDRINGFISLTLLSSSRPPSPQFSWSVIRESSCNSDHAMVHTRAAPQAQRAALKCNSAHAV